MNFSVALVFARRWVAAMTKRMFQSQGTEFAAGTARRFTPQSSTANPAKSSKVANNALP